MPSLEHEEYPQEVGSQVILGDEVAIESVAPSVSQ